MPKNISIYPSGNETSRACLYGDGLFETIAFRQGELLFWQDHWQRLKDGLIRLHYADRSDADSNEESILSYLHTHISHPTQDQVIRLSISRLGQRGYRIPQNGQWAIDVQCSPFPENRWDSKTINVCWCQTTWARQPLLAGIKHLNRLEQVLARSEWQDPSIAEGLVCDTEGYVISGTMSGLAWRKDQTIFASDLSQTGIASTARKRFLQQKQSEGYTIVLGYFLPEAIMQADEVWLMNAVQGIATAVLLSRCC